MTAAARRPISPPSTLALLGEVRAVVEPLRLLLRSPALATAPRGHGETVLVLPGFGAGDASTGVLRTYLRWIGYRATGWGLGRNDGRVRALVPRVLRLLEEERARTSRPSHVVGWSLGGVLAREAGRERPELTASIVTLGSPVVGGPKYTAAAASFRRRGEDLDEIERLVDSRFERPLRVPVTAIFSKSDGVVAWEAAIDRRSAGIEHVEVAATHLGLGFSPEVFAIVADRLARHRDRVDGR